MNEIVRVESADAVSLCSFRVDDRLFGFETVKVHEVLDVRAMLPVPRAPAFVAGVTPYRGEILMVLSLRRLLGLAPNEGLSNVIVLEDEHEGELFGLAVDAIGHVLSVNAGDFEENAATLDERNKMLFAGNYKLAETFVTHLKPELFWPMRLMALYGE